MAEKKLHLSIRTPAAVVLEREVSSIRVPSQTGQVGVRPRAEAMVLSVEPGLVLVREDGRFLFVGTAGGLLRSHGLAASILTPLAVSGKDEEEVLAELERALGTPTAEMEARALLGQLQGSILRELRESRGERLESAGRPR